MSAQTQDVQGHSLALPAELTDAIIDCLAADLPNSKPLKAATLVCKTWSPRAQFHLFERMTWRIDFDGRVAREPMATFASSSVRKYVQHITLKFFVKAQERNVAAAQLFLCHFSSVRSLTLACTAEPPTVMGLDFARALSGAFPALRALELGNVLCESGADLLKLVCSFKALVSLDLKRPWQLALSKECKAEPLRSLQSLTVSRVPLPMGDFFHFLLGTSGIAHLEYLTLETYAISQMNDLLASGPLLVKDLTIRGYLDKPDPLVLRNCGSLINLELGVKAAVVPVEDIEWVAATLATLPSPCVLQRLTVSIRLSSADVEEVLQSFSQTPAIASLRNVTVHLTLDVPLELALVDPTFLRLAENLFREAEEKIAPQAELSMQYSYAHRRF